MIFPVDYDKFTIPSEVQIYFTIRIFRRSTSSQLMPQTKRTPYKFTYYFHQNFTVVFYQGDSTKTCQTININSMHLGI